MKYRLVVYLRGGTVHTSMWMNNVTFQRIREHRDVVMNGQDLIIEDQVSGYNVMFRNDAIDAVSIESSLTFKEKVIEFFTLGD